MGNASLGNGCFLEPRERHQAIGIGRVVGRATGFFLRTSLHVGVKVVIELQSCLVLLWEPWRWGGLRAACILGVDCGYP